MHALALGVIEPHLVVTIDNPSLAVLDVGCGSGYLTACLAELIGTSGHGALAMPAADV